MERLSAILAVGSTVLVLSGCMTVRIESPGKPARVTRHVGVLQVEVPQAGQAVVGSITGVGVTSTPMGWTGGFTRQRWAVLGKECRAVVFLDPGARLDAQAQQALAGVAGACLLTDEPSSTLAREQLP